MQISCPPACATEALPGGTPHEWAPCHCRTCRSARKDLWCAASGVQLPEAQSPSVPVQSPCPNMFQQNSSTPYTSTSTDGTSACQDLLASRCVYSIMIMSSYGTSHATRTRLTTIRCGRADLKSMANGRSLQRRSGHVLQLRAYGMFKGTDED
jgi:hypothetical protein